MKATAKTPTVDVVIPVLNGERFIVQALASVAAQDHPPATIIVVDDGSTDSTARLVQTFQSPVPVRYLYQENRGLSSARNAGIAQCRSEFVAFLDADDEWAPEKLSRQLALFRESGLANLAAVYCEYLVIDEEGRVTPGAHVVAADPACRGMIFGRLLRENRITGSGSAILVRRRCLEEVGGFDERFKACEDWDLWLRIAERHEFDFVPERLVRIRRHGANMQVNSDFMFENALLLYDKWSGAALAQGCHGVWRDSVTWKIAGDLPRLDSLRLARRVLQPGAGRRLFPGGSLLLSFLLNARSILILLAKRALGSGGGRGKLSGGGRDGKDETTP